MGLEIKNRKIHIIHNENEEPDEFFNVSSLTIPFSLIFKKNSSKDIYSGEEIIPFEEKLLEFRQILINEFLVDD